MEIQTTQLLLQHHFYMQVNNLTPTHSSITCEPATMTRTPADSTGWTPSPAATRTRSHCINISIATLIRLIILIHWACFLYLMLIAYMPYSALRLSMLKEFSMAQRDILMFSGIAFLGGVVCVFSNWQEQHFLIMYMLYISIYKVYLYRGKPTRI